MSSKKTKKSKKKGIVWSIIGVLVLGIAATIVFSPKGPGPYIEEKVQKGNITTYYTFSGAVEAKNRKTIMSDKMMQIKDILVKEGDIVESGDVLMKTRQGGKIKATIDGEITKIFTEEDVEVMSGVELIEIVDYSNLQTNVRVDEYDLQYLAVDQKVSVMINALGKELNGNILEISKEATNENGVSYFTVTIGLEKDESVRVGMNTEAKILKQNATNIATLPMDAVQFDVKNKAYVLVRSEKGEPTKKYIETGINDGTVVEVKSGIGVGEMVLIPKSLNNPANSHSDMMATGGL